MPNRARFVLDNGSEIKTTPLDFKVESRGQLHKISWTVNAESFRNSEKILLVTSFSDGTEDRTQLELIIPQPGKSTMPLDRVRRDRDAYQSVTPEDDEWFMDLNDLAVAYEKLGCDSQAANLVVDWYFSEPENESAKEALLGLARPFELGAIDKLFGPTLPPASDQPILVPDSPPGR